MRKDLVDGALALLTGQAAQPSTTPRKEDRLALWRDPPNIEGASKPEAAGPLLAVKLCSPVIGDYWFCLSDTEPFDPGDGLPVYRPSEIRALKGKGYGPEALQTVHRVKTVFDGKVVGH